MNGVGEVYDPAAWDALTFKVAPTLRVWVPVPLSVPVVAGLLMKVPAVMLFAPLVRVVAVPGRVIEEV